MNFTYYLTRESDSLLALRQVRYKESHMSGVPTELDVCLFVKNEEELREVLQCQNISITEKDIDWEIHVAPKPPPKPR